MYKQKISININSDFEIDKILDEFEILLGYLCKTGQIQGDYETPFIAGNNIVCYQTSIEKDSLSSIYNDKYVDTRIENLRAWCKSDLEFEIVGKEISNPKGICTCKDKKYLILFTHLFSNTSPIDCGICFKPVPIYRLNLDYDLRMDLFNWESNYKSCDKLQLGCIVGEKWAMKQMSDPSSQLSIQGKNVCREIEKTTALPTYYYLFNYRRITYNQDISRSCPQCNQKWFLREKINNYYAFKCDECLLISTISDNLKP